MWQACVRLALGQEGLITLNQALSAMLSVDAFKRHVAKATSSGYCRRSTGWPDSRDTPRQRLRAMCFWGGDGAAVSHSSAAALVHLKGFTLDLHAVATKNPQRLPG